MRANFKYVLRTRELIKTLFLGNFMVAATAWAAPVRKPAPHNTMPVHDAGVCSKMSADYEFASKSLALNNAMAKNEKSQIRASQLASEDNVTITQANMTLGLMRDNHCPMPTYAASSGRYVMQSMDCSVALAKQQAEFSAYSLSERLGVSAPRPSTDMPEECDISRWTYGQSHPVAEHRPVAAVVPASTVNHIPRPSSPYKIDPTLSSEGPCPFCGDPDGKRLQGAWDSQATTPEQKSKMVQIVSAHVANGFIDWESTAKAYFDWRQTQPYGFR